MRISVTLEDIRDGRRGNCKVCPLAMAISRATGKKCSVVRDAVYIEDANKSNRVPLPPIALDFRECFDDGMSGFSAFEFELVLPGELVTT